MLWSGHAVSFFSHGRLALGTIETARKVEQLAPHMRSSQSRSRVVCKEGSSMGVKDQPWGTRLGLRRPG